jgi:hypothetical protein
MSHISMRDLQKMSAETISALPGLTAIKSGNRTVAFLTPLRKANMERLASVLAEAEALARDRDPAADDELLREFGEVDPTNWSIEAVRALKTKAG